MSSVDVFVAEDRTRPRHLVELGEHLLLQRQVLEHGLDDRRPPVSKPSSVELRMDAAEPIAAPCPAVNRPRATDVVVVAPDRSDARVEGLLGRVVEAHVETRVRARHRDAAAHRAGADDGDALHRCRLDLVRHPGNLVHRPLGEEHVDQRLRRFGADRLEEERGLAAPAFARTAGGWRLRSRRSPSAAPAGAA